MHALYISDAADGEIPGMLVKALELPDDAQVRVLPSNQQIDLPAEVLEHLRYIMRTRPAQPVQLATDDDQMVRLRAEHARLTARLEDVRAEHPEGW